MSNQRRSPILPVAMLVTMAAVSVSAASRSLNKYHEDDIMCHNDAPLGHQDHGCPPERPICVNDNGQEPPYGGGETAGGVQCVPCVAYTDHPAEPDWGCSADQPLCVVTTSSRNNVRQPQRPLEGLAGDACVPYPCHNTKSFHAGNHVDQGCTADQPFCVDGLGSDPPVNGPGMQCVGIGEVDSPEQQQQQQQGQRKPKRRWGRRPTSTFITASSQQDTLLSYKPSFSVQSLCVGCPISGQGRSCEATKACDTLGGVITSW